MTDFERKQILEQLDEVNKYVGTSLIDKKLGQFIKQYPYLSLDFGIWTKRYYICGSKGERVM